MSRPNVVIVLTDQMRSTAMGCTGIERVKTPNLDAFAAEGIRFTNAVSNTPACTPARATLLTGRHVLSHGAVCNDLRLDTSQTTFAHALNELGYDCAYIGKWHLDGGDRGGYIPPGPRRRGFNSYWAATECNHHYNAGYHYDDNSRQPVWFDCYEPVGQSKLASSFIASRRSEGQPFCLVLGFGPPHCPYDTAPDRHKDHYPPESIEFLPNAVGGRFQRTSLDHFGDTTDLVAAEQSSGLKRAIMAGYYSHITALDASFGTVMQTLRDTGLDRETIVLFTSDHGDMLFSQDRGWKGKPWRESIGVPLIVRWPGRIPMGSVSNAPIGLVDIAPSLIGLVGGLVPTSVEGRDLSALLLGDETAAPPSQFINFPCKVIGERDPAWRGVVTERYTYVRSVDGPWLLYDDVADPFQMTNRVGDTGLAPQRMQLELQLQDWLDRTHDEFLSAREIADRYAPGHVNGVVPIEPLNERIRNGQSERSDRRY